jgi:hypothetical protein
MAGVIEVQKKHSNFIVDLYAKLKNLKINPLDLISTQENNQLELGEDNKLFVPESLIVPETIVFNEPILVDVTNNLILIRTFPIGKLSDYKNMVVNADFMFDNGGGSYSPPVFYLIVELKNLRTNEVISLSNVSSSSYSRTSHYIYNNLISCITFDGYGSSVYELPFNINDNYVANVYILMDEIGGATNIVTNTGLTIQLYK